VRILEYSDDKDSSLFDTMPYLYLIVTISLEYYLDYNRLKRSYNSSPPDLLKLGPVAQNEILMKHKKDPL
jgi:hypothetical protein